jgi:GWxTD domain-containing protein
VKKNKINKRYLLFAVFVILIFSQVGYSGDQFHLNLDHAQFLSSDNQCYLELYYSYPEDGPQYQKDENNEFVSAVYFTLNIFQDDSLWANKQWKIEKKIPDTTILSDSKKNLVDLIRYPIDGGHTYSLRLYAKDYYSGKVDSVKTKLVGKNYVEDQVCMSDLLLAMSVQPFSQTSDPKFRKRIYDIVPHPNLTFGTDLHELYYYFEIYNLVQDTPDSQYAVLWQIQDSTGQVVAENANNLEWRQIAHESSREIGQIGVLGLDNGCYTLMCDVITPSGKLNQIANSKKFFIYKAAEQTPDVTRATLVEQPTFLEGFDEQQLDLEYDQMYALTTKDLRKIYSNLKTLKDKKTQVYNLWSMTASTIGMPIVAFRKKFLEMIKEADENYKSTFKPGWKTDQGIVFLKYGPPSDIERHPSEAGTKPYEVWRYEHLQGGVIFVFIDRTGFNRYELIHSNMRGELSDPNWQRYITPNPFDRYE